jgi:microcystin-dependent protein
MSNYNKATNFAVKDTLTSGDPDKVVSGAEIDNEFNSIASAVTSKADKVAAATTDNLAALDANGNLKDSGGSIVSVAPPVGSITMYGGSSAPSGWLYCNGQNVSRTTFANLFSAIGETFGAGDGSSTFSLPDLRDRFPLGDNSNGGADASRVDNFSTGLGDTGGADEHQLTEAEMPSHSHSVPVVREGSNLLNRIATDTEVDAGTKQTNSTGGDQAHNNMPPFLAVSFIIKT